MIDTFRVLLVCTGNICRSPAAERLLRSGVQTRITSAESKVRITSAGTHAMVGWPIDPPTATALLERRVDPGQHEARLLTAAEVAEADLVLGATRVHRAAAVSLHPRALPYSFTIPEFARLADSVVSRPGYVSHSPQALLADIRAARGIVRATDPAADDIADPYGRSGAAHSVTVAAIAAATEVIASAITGALGASATGQQPPTRVVFERP